ncbi:MAG TPA: GH92 family glycosyl hydrolase, partial [Polyangiaceae bacterium]|nr:GH92 family glycosyl hydrolase [Polyangiaceae bacterium]
MLRPLVRQVVLALVLTGCASDRHDVASSATTGGGGSAGKGAGGSAMGAASGNANTGGSPGSGAGGMPSAGSPGGGSAGAPVDTSGRPSVAGYVDPIIGTLNYSNTFPGAVVPWGMASPSPHNQTGWVPAGYRYQAGDIHAFANSHISGAGCPDLGSVWIMPYTGDVPTDPMAAASVGSGEQAQAGYYAVTLDKYAVVAEMTATERTALYRFTFPARSGDAEIVMDAARNQSSGSSGTIAIVSDTEVSGVNHSGQFCYGKWNEDNPVYFFARFSKPASAKGTIDGSGLSANLTQSGGSAGAYFRYSTTDGEALEVRIGLSYVSTENAKENLEAESASLAFDTAKEQAFDAWDEKLKRIIVEGGSEDDKTIFYTALYHALLEPNVASDVNGAHPSMEQPGMSATSSRTEYTIYSLWDTYRTVHPLLTLVYPEIQADMVETMVSMAKESGYLPKWELDRNESMVMVGDPAAIVIADSYLKGVTNFDVDTAYSVMVKQATQDNPVRPEIGDYQTLGFIPADNPSSNYLPTVPPFCWGAVSTTLEYALADWNIAELAAALGKTDDAATFHDRAKAYEHFYDSGTGFLRPKNADGS